MSSCARRVLHGKTALVTGGSSGIGAAISRLLAQSGARVVLVGRSKKSLEAVALACKRPDVMQTYVTDLSKDRQVSELAKSVQADFGGIDILVHSAGAFALAGIDAANEADFDRQYRINVRVPSLLTRLAAPSLRLRQGQVVFINSSVARLARAGIGHYAATKAGLKALADSFREELNPQGVRVLSVFVGRTATPMQQAIFKEEGREYKPECLLQPEDVATIVVNCLTLPRTAEVTELDIRPMMKP